MDFHPDTLLALWGGLSAALSGRVLPVEVEIVREAGLFRLTAHCEPAGVPPHVTLRVAHVRSGVVRHWEISELPAAIGGEDIRARTLRWCGDIRAKAVVALDHAGMTVAISGSRAISLLPELEELLPTYPEMVGNSTGSSWPMEE